MTRQAISPRLAIRILSNGGFDGAALTAGFAAGLAAALTAGRAAFFLAAIIFLTILQNCGPAGPSPRRYGARSAAAIPPAPRPPGIARADDEIDGNDHQQGHEGRDYIEYERVLAGLQRDEQRLRDSADYERVVIWSEPDCYDQLVLVRLLAHYAIEPRPPRVELINVGDFPGATRFIGLGQLPPEALRALADAKARHGRTARARTRCLARVGEPRSSRPRGNHAHRNTATAAAGRCASSAPARATGVRHRVVFDGSAGARVARESGAELESNLRGLDVRGRSAAGTGRSADP